MTSAGRKGRSIHHTIVPTNPILLRGRITQQLDRSVHSVAASLACPGPDRLQRQVHLPRARFASARIWVNKEVANVDLNRVSEPRAGARTEPN